MPIKATTKRAGFTLIELLIVMAILALLAGIIGPSLWNKLGGAKHDVALTQIKNIEVALDSYRLDMGRYPKNLDEMIKNNSGKARWDGPYMKSIPLDPWGKAYEYQLSGDHNGREYTLLSLGADGQEGGEGEDKDIHN